ncbi:MAG: tetratricopeptide repeat protein [Phycisphaerae bacterium]
MALLRSRTTVVWTLASAACGLWVGGCASAGGRTALKSDEADARMLQRMSADRAFHAGRFDQAVRSYSRLLEGASKDASETATLHYQLGQALWHRAGRRGASAAVNEARDVDEAAAIEHCRNALSELEALPSGQQVALSARIGRTLGTYLRRRGKIDEAMAVYQRILAASPDTGEDRARTLGDLGAAYLERSRQAAGRRAGSGDDDLTRALQHLESALSLARHLDAPPADLLVLIHNSTGLAYNERMQPGAAAEQFSTALKIAKDNGMDALVGSLLANLIPALIEVGRNGEAVARCEELEALPVAASDPQTLAVLGMAYLALGDLARSRQQFDLARYLVHQDASVVSDPTFSAQLACNTAAVAQAVGAYEEAERLLLEALEDARAGGVDPRTVAVIQANLGRMYLTLERLDDADAQLNRAKTLFGEIEGPQHADVLVLLLDLANLARARGHLLEASALCEDAVRGLLAVRGRAHPDVAAARLELASLLSAQGRCDAARQQAESAMQSLDARFGEEHKRAVLACLKTALIALQCAPAEGRDESMQALIDKAARRFALLREALGADNIEVLRASVYFADVSARSPAALESALGRYRRAEQGFADVYGDTTKSLAALRLKQGRVLQKLGRPEDALQTYQRALRLMDRNLMQHPIHAELLAAMGDALNATGDRDRAMQQWRQALHILAASYGHDHPRVRRFKETHLPQP